MAILSMQELGHIFDDLQRETAALRDLSDNTKRREAVVELREKILTAQRAAQEAHTAILQEVNQLKEELVHFKDWKAEAASYQPQRFEPGVTVYIEKQAMVSREAVTHYCPNCYANEKVRVLQGTDKTEARRQVRVCLECDKALAYGPQEPMPRQRFADEGGGSWMTR